jgi:hypothetical protein
MNIIKFNIFSWKIDNKNEIETLKNTINELKNQVSMILKEKDKTTKLEE